MVEGQKTAVLVVASDIYGRPEAKRRECSRGWDERGFAEKEERRILSNFGNIPVRMLRKFAFATPLPRPAECKDSVGASTFMSTVYGFLTAWQACGVRGCLSPALKVKEILIKYQIQYGPI